MSAWKYPPRAQESDKLPLFDCVVIAVSAFVITFVIGSFTLSAIQKAAYDAANVQEIMEGF